MIQTQWNDFHSALMFSMQKEVTLMRDLLTNLHQEELSLLMHDRNSWNQLMEERAGIIQRLGSWRLARMEAVKKLLPGRVQKEAPLEEILPSQDENSCEVLSLRDQIMALAERMNRQNSRNMTLSHQVENHLDLPPIQRHYASAAPQKKKRASVITYPFNE
ncbi:MAG: hypothetical protein HYX48_00215 [Chlamydiales bacterium]|nr:hypothetical protein [Chlamydiales bacterium]